jgi:hypothetical protein
MENTITCWLGVNENGSFTPHSIFDYSDCIRNKSITDILDWSFAVTLKETSNRGWNYMSKYIQKVVYSDDPLVLAEVVRQSSGYEIGKISVFADTSIFNEMVKAGVFCPLEIISPLEKVAVQLYKTVGTEQLSDNRYLHHLVPVGLADGGDDAISTAIAVEEMGMNRQELTKRSQNSVIKQLTELERISRESEEDALAFDNDGDIAVEENTNRALIRLSDIVDDVCVDVDRMEDVINGYEPKINEISKKSSAALTLANSAIKRLTSMNLASKQSVEDLAEHVGTVVNEKNDLEQSVSRMRKALYAITAVTGGAIAALFYLVL